MPALCLYFASLNKYLRTIRWLAKLYVWKWELNSEPDGGLYPPARVCFVIRKIGYRADDTTVYHHFIKFCRKKVQAKVDPDLAEPEVCTIWGNFFKNEK